jgi:methylated-DNA-[protein]-cysteine S-methyltransferase
MYTAYYNSPIGIVEIVSDEDSILRLDFVETAGCGAEKMPAILEDALKQVEEYFKGTRKAFDLKLSLNGTEFQQKVWSQLREVPYGATVSYGEIAKAINNTKGCRAVGGANNKNKIAIIIPCHRVVGADGSLTGYAGGLWRKEWLLKHEKHIR